MRICAVVTETGPWKTRLSSVQTVTAKEYLTAPEWSRTRGVRVVNLCRSYRYQSAGYYVSLLAAARGHRPVPSLMALLDLKSRALVRLAGEELDELVQKSLGKISSDRFVLSVYFGRNMARQHERLALRIFNLFPAPLLRVQFVFADRWHITSIGPIPAHEIPDSHWPFVLESARTYFGRARGNDGGSADAGARRRPFDMAILHDPDEVLAPSSPKALQRFATAANALGFDVEFVRKDDIGRLPEFDALFIRETTRVNHHTFRFAQRARSEGLVVIDDPQSILRCSNKVFQAEVMRQANVPMPKTVIVERDGVSIIESEIGFPCVLKHPDGAFSQGVSKVSGPEELQTVADGILAQSDLLVAQEFVPSGFDWRVGVLAGEPLYACRYHMARGHWQIIKKTDETYSYGRIEPIPLDTVPKRVVETALRACEPIGEGLYGVDLKQVGRRVIVMEVNDNPNIDVGCEDALLGAELYTRIMSVFLERVRALKQELPR